MDVLKEKIAGRLLQTRRPDIVDDDIAIGKRRNATHLACLVRLAKLGSDYE